MRELWWIPVTVAVWLLARRATRGTTAPLANPTLIGVAVVGGLVLLSGVGARAYADGTAALSWLLGPAVVALAVPLHQERERLRRHARALLAGAVVGASVSALLGYGLVRLLQLPSPFELALTTRSATTPISVALANGLGGLPALSAVASIFTGLVGATVGPALLTRLGVRDPVARGVAMGVCCHGIGTERLLRESRGAGATSSVGMGLGGLLVAVVVPLLW